MISNKFSAAAAEAAATETAAVAEATAASVASTRVLEVARRIALKTQSGIAEIPHQVIHRKRESSWGQEFC